ncbi:MAG: flavodoxin-dependent (E)-4-hydroxy-3-methylbut-2-enyl-diphosphate synthase [Clostridia bacterium]|nr:flavodoxin-dependent (E)-4-hydroxy-3-methylbut-2-enyl-diphosphate synthase [Clostridia bacterium]
MKNTRQIKVGDRFLGGDAPILVQSMCNTDTADINSTVTQINELAAQGCDIIRVAVPDFDAANALKEIKKNISIPLVADIHFDYRLAVESAKNGADKIRINPGNIGGEDKLREVIAACKDRNIPVRVGVNSGSLDRELLNKYGNTPRALAESAMRSVSLLCDRGFEDICISIKSSSVFKTVKTYRLVSEMCDFPLHLGVTEAGGEEMGTIKSAAAFGALLVDGIGDTLRVSLTDDPVKEVVAAKKILKALDLHTSGVNIISCPTCGRTRVDLIPLAAHIEKRLCGVKTKLNVAVMGCAVNGPGEAREADIGIACGKGEGLIFKHGEILYKVPENELADKLIEEIEKMTGEKI